MRATGDSVEVLEAERSVLLGRISELEQHLAASQRMLEAIRGHEQRIEEVRVDERQYSKQNLESHLALLRAVSLAQSEFIADAEPSILFDRLLSDLLALTQSEYGFIGEVLHKPDGTPYLKTWAITNIAWNKETREFYEENAPKGLEFNNMKTLFGESIMTGKPIIANAPYTDPRRGGLPHGHPALNAFLGLPMFLGDTMVGNVGIANRPGGYEPELINYLSPFLTTCASLITAYRNERRRRETERALRESETRNRALISAMPDLMLVIDRDGTLLDIKPPKEGGVDLPATAAVGMDINDALPVIAEQCMPHLSLVLRMGEPYLGEFQAVAGGQPSDHEVRIVPCGEGVALIIVRNITARKRAEQEQERARLREELIRAQDAALAELSTPLIPISDEIVIMPLIGTMDPQRAERAVTALLQGVRSQRARFVILDITGVTVADVNVANTVVRAAQAVRLLGAKTVLTGIRPEVAQMLVELDVDLSGIVTRGTLQSGIAFASNQR